MNGDVGKLPSGAVVNNSYSEAGTSIGTMSEYVPINGVTQGAEGSSLAPPSAPQDAATNSVYSLPQLKQMLSQQLEYYFSRYQFVFD